MKNHPQDDKDKWSEDEAEICAGVTDTLLTPPDFMNHNERQCILNVAPAEGNKQLTEFKYEFFEELAYPGIFPGENKAWSQRSLSQSFFIVTFVNQN